MLALVLVLAFAAPATRDPDVVAGEAAYREGRWDDASVAFDAAWRRTGNPTFLYTRAQVERRAGRCPVAIELYEQFLGTSPGAQAAAAAERNLDACKASLPATEPEPPPDPVPPAETPTDLPPPTTPRSWRSDPVAPVLVALGGAALVTGGALVGVAYRNVDRADDAPDDRGYADRLAGARRLEIAGATLMPIGTALVVGGIIRWALVARAARQSCRSARACAAPRRRR